MKRILAVILLLIAVVLASCAVVEHREDTHDYLRIHIRANSNSDIDQSVKYAIKGEIVKLLTPELRRAKTPEEAKRIVSSHMDSIDKVANTMLEANKLPYRAHSVMRQETFPVRHYGNVTLSAGEYDALIVELGRAEGDNWWCVVFPPLCFVGTEEVGSSEIRYVSKIKELIDNMNR